MQDNSFDKHIQQQLRDVSIDPPGHVWTAVEKELDKKKRRFPFVWWIFPLLLLGIGTALYFAADRINEATEDKTTYAGKKAEQAITSKSLTQITPAKATLQHPDTPSAFTGPLVTGRDIPMPYQKPAAIQINSISVQNTKKEVGVVSKKIIKNEAQQKVNIAGAHAENQEANSELATLNDTATAIRAETVISSVEKDAEKLQPKPGDSSTVDTQKSLLPPGKKSKINGWQSEWLIAGGFTQVRALSFSNSGAELLYSPGTSGSNPNQGTNTRVRNEYKFNTGVQLAAGWQVNRPLSKKLAFVTGLHYSYQSAAVDKRVIVDSATSLGTSVSYTTLSTEQFQQRLVLHSFHVPLLVRYSPVQKLAISTGLYNQFLFAGNWNDFSTVLGKRKTYLPVFHLNPSLVLDKVAVGPFINIGLRQYSNGQSLVNYGLQLRFTPGK